MGERGANRYGVAVVKPEGGYRLIPLSRLFAAWWCYQQGDLEFRDLRVYFALEEMAARRCVMKQGRTARYTLNELGELAGANGAKTLKASLRRLERSGLSTWNAGRIEFPESNQAITRERFDWSLARIGNHRRRVPVPRRTIRWLARATRPVLVATVLGHLFRCVYAKGRLIAAEGSISASWVAGVFGVDLRNVKRAKAQLRALNWLSVKESEFWRRQRYGQRVVVNFSWGGSGNGTGIRKLPPRHGDSDLDLPPPRQNRELLDGLKNQKPASSGPAGVSKTKPHLKNVKAEDLRDTARVLTLYRQAEARGLVGKSESERLSFVGAAVRASEKATKNPGGFFWRLVRDKLWHHVTATEENRANAMLKRHLFERPRVVNPPAKARPADGKTIADIRFVAQVTSLLRDRGCLGDPFELVAKHDPRWTRTRWDQAMRGWLTPEMNR
jgi:hypothetical protein